MRIRYFRPGDISTIISIRQASAIADRIPAMSEEAFIAWFLDPDREAQANAFVMTDDDDELLTWGQAGTLEGIEGEIVGYTILECLRDAEGYHLRCRGAVHPEHRCRGAGRALLAGALNRARLLASDFEFEAEAEGVPIYFEAFLPAADPASSHLAVKCDLEAVQQFNSDGLQLYRMKI
ncbi:GNAT family N-acetyltransferase [Dictyobacter halimunensis]